jgi:hypothetical protein
LSFVGIIRKSALLSGISSGSCFSLRGQIAYSADSGHRFRRKAAGSSDGSRPVIPGQSGHPVGAQRRW